jgi:hypothetical protein
MSIHERKKEKEKVRFLTFDILNSALTPPPPSSQISTSHLSILPSESESESG